MRVVSVMAHQDDELMCLGTMLKMKEMGCSLAFICLTDGSKGIGDPPNLSRGEVAAIRRAEMGALTADLGAQYICLEEADEFLYDSSELRIKLLDALRFVKADVIFTHFTTDYNLDHTTTNTLVLQSAIHMPLPMIQTDSEPTGDTPAVFMIEPFGGFSFEPTHWVDIGSCMDEKMRLSRFHTSQHDAFIKAFGEGKGIDNWVMETSSKRGDQAGVKYAEAFRPMFARGLVKAHSILP